MKAISDDFLRYIVVMCIFEKYILELKRDFIMMTRKLLLVFGFFCILNVTKTIKAQVAPTYPIILNEYCVSNVPAGHADERGVLNDYVEIYNNHTASLSLSSYYLSNDRFNLKNGSFQTISLRFFPAPIPVYGYRVVIPARI